MVSDIRNVIYRCNKPNYTHETGYSNKRPNDTYDPKFRVFHRAHCEQFWLYPSACQQIKNVSHKEGAKCNISLNIHFHDYDTSGDIEFQFSMLFKWRTKETLPFRNWNLTGIFSEFSVLRVQANSLMWIAACKTKPIHFKWVESSNTTKRHIMTLDVIGIRSFSSELMRLGGGAEDWWEGGMGALEDRNAWKCRWHFTSVVLHFLCHLPLWYFFFRITTPELIVLHSRDASTSTSYYGVHVPENVSYRAPVRCTGLRRWITSSKTGTGYWRRMASYPT